MVRFKQFVTVLGLGPLLGGTTLLPITPAHAAVYQVTCGGNQTTTYQPGLTNQPQTVTRSGQDVYTPCVSTQSPDSFSGTTSFTSTTTLSCDSLLTANSGTDVIAWTTGTTSTFSYDRTVSLVNGQTVVTLTGAIIAGQYTGATAVETITSVALDLSQCSSATGLTSTYGVTELTITGI